MIGRAPRDPRDHMVLLKPGVVAGYAGRAQCGLEVRVLNNGDALYAWDVAEPGRHACPKCRRAKRPPKVIVDDLLAAQERVAVRPHEPPHQPRP